jgi:hypothetical protein
MASLHGVRYAGILNKDGMHYEHPA